MSTYDDASLIYYPSGYKEDKIYSLKPTDGSGDLTFTRASSATRVNADGLIEQVPYNLVQQSNTFNTTWIPSGLSRTANTIANPLNGAVNAYTLTLNSGTASKFITQPISQSGVYTQSVYLKSGTHQFVQLLVGSDASHYANFDLVNGTFSSFGSTIDATIESVIGGWYRCTFTYNTSTGQDVYIWAVNSLSSARAASTSSSGDFYIYGFQLNIGSTAKPYFPTTDRLNVPRIDYTGGGCGKLLLESQRTNLALYNISFSGWSTIASTITANYGISPDGTTNATRILRTGSVRSVVYQNISVTNGQTYTVSLYVKSLSGTQNVRIGADNGCVNPQGAETFAVGEEWTRIEKSITSTQNSWNIFIDNVESGIGCTGTYGALDILAYGFQAELGSYSTSLINTTSTAVTRTQDAAFKTGISSLIGQTEGTIFFNVNYKQLSTTARFITISNATNSNLVQFYTSANSSTLRGYIAINGTIIFDGTIKNLNISEFFKIAIAYKSGDTKIYVDGNLLITRNIIYTTGIFNVLNFANQFNNSPFEGQVQSLMVFPSALSDTELATLTTI